MNFNLGGLLQQVLGADAVQDQFHQAAQGAAPDLLSQGLAAMFRSDQTPAFGQLAGQLFGQANGAQQAGMLSHLLNGMGPAALSALLGGAAAGGSGGAGLAGLLGPLLQGGSRTVSLTPEQASRFTPEQVQQLANHAEQHDPGVIEHMSTFYAEHATLVKTLGGAALSIALAHMAEGRKA